MLLTVFRSRLRPEAAEEYEVWAARMDALACTMPGYRSHKTFTAADGERVTLVEFDSQASQQAWAAHPGHVEAQNKGRELFYSDFSIQVCKVVRSAGFARGS